MKAFKALEVSLIFAPLIYRFHSIETVNQCANLMSSFPQRKSYFGKINEECHYLDIFENTVVQYYKV